MTMECKSLTFSLTISNDICLLSYSKHVI